MNGWDGMGGCVDGSSTYARCVHRVLLTPTRPPKTYETCGGKENTWGVFSEQSFDANDDVDVAVASQHRLRKSDFKRIGRQQLSRQSHASHDVESDER